MTTIRALQQQLRTRQVSARQIVEDCLGRIENTSGEGARAFLSVDADGARFAADEYDRLRHEGGRVPPFAGIPIAIKDLCDIEGQTTKAGSIVLADAPPAEADATVVARARAAGFVIIGRTNMTEFAYSGLGLNVHYDTPRSPWDRESGRIPGGSSSGTAVAVADGMAPVGLGTDTGGSCRIPAAFCSIVGYKPTAKRVPLDGVIPLSFSLDSIGPLANTVDCCAIVDHVFAGGGGAVDNRSRDPRSIRLGAIQDYVLEDLDKEVADIYFAALKKLSAAGVVIEEIEFPELNRLPEINRGGGIAAAEAFAWHRELLAQRGADYDQRVLRRIKPGAETLAADYLRMFDERKTMQQVATRRLADLDGFVLPSVAIVPPTIESFGDGDGEHYSKKNILSLRNTSVGNFLDTCSVSMPAAGLGNEPVGVMLMGSPMGDADLFEVARGIEHILSRG